MNPTGYPSRCLIVLTSLLLLAFSGCASTRLSQATAELPEAGSPSEVVLLPKAVAGNPAPVYPLEMRRDRMSGMVHVDCVVDERGRVLVASVRDSTHRALVKPTLEAVQQWTFEPGSRDGAPAAMRVILPVQFTMAP